MITNAKLLIDENCPMCSLYGKAFIKSGLVAKEVIVSYQSVEEYLIGKIDKDRAQTEIALINLESNKTEYGIDSLITILGSKSTFITELLKSKLIYTFLKALYSFISSNRKVIYPTKFKEANRSCEPQFNLCNRSIYIILVALITGLILNSLVYELNQYFGFSHNLIREYIICFAQIVWQGIFVSFTNRNKLFEYLGNMSTVSLIGGILLIPILMLNQIFQFSGLVLMACFSVVVLIILLEHIRRVSVLGLNKYLTVSWLSFRMFVLGIILIELNIF